MVKHHELQMEQKYNITTGDICGSSLQSLNKAVSDLYLVINNT